MELTEQSQLTDCTDTSRLFSFPSWKETLFKVLCTMKLPTHSLATTYSVLTLGLYQLQLGFLVPFLAQTSELDSQYPNWLESVLSYVFVTHPIQLYVALSVSIGALLSVALTVLQEYVDKRCGQWLLRLTTAATSEFCSVALFVPVSAWTLKQFTTSLEPVYALVSVICVMPVVILKLMRSVFHCDLSHSESNCFSKAHTRLDCQEFIAVLLATVLTAYARSPVFMSVVWGGTSVYMLYGIYVYQPYHRLSVNFLIATGWTLNLLTSLGTCGQVYLPHFSCVLFASVAFPVVTISFLYVLLQRRQALLRLKPSTPYRFELRLRARVHRVNSKKERYAEVMREFAEAKTEFMYFPLLFLWEHYYLKDVCGKVDLAMNRLYLVKIIDSNYLDKWMHERTLNYPRCPGLWPVQIEYWFYIAFHARTQLQEKTETMKVLESYKSLQKYKRLEHTVLSKLVKALVHLQDPTEESAAIIQQQAIKAADAITSLRSFFQSVNVASYYHRELLYSSKGFVNDILKNSKILGGSVLANLLEHSLQNLNSPSQACVIVLSAHKDCIGRVLHTNVRACEVLMYGADELIGLHFSDLVPSPFNVLTKNTFQKFLLHRPKAKITRPHFFVISKEGLVIEVSMELAAVCFDGDVFFVATFTQNFATPQFLLLTEDFCISSYSQGFSTLEAVQSGVSFETVFPGITSLFREDSFIFTTRDRQFFCTVKVLSFDGYTVYVLYMEAPHGFARPASVHRGSTYEEAMVDFIQEFRDGQKRERENQSTLISQWMAGDCRRRSHTKPERILVTKTVRYSCIARALMRVGGFLTLLLISGYIVGVDYAMTSSGLNELIKNVGALRLQTIQCVLSVRSLQLLDSGEQFVHSRAEYQTKLQQSSALSKDLLHAVMQDAAALGIEDFFRPTEVTVYNKHSTEVTSETLTLVEAFEKLCFLSSVLAEAEEVRLSDDSFYFVFRNGPTVIFESVHQVVGLVTESSLQKYGVSGARLDLLTLLVGIPPLLLFIGVLLLTHQLELISRRVWRMLEQVHGNKVSQLYNLLTTRAELFHPTIEVPTLPQKALKDLHKSLRWPLVLKLGSISMVCGVLCLTLVFTLHSQLLTSLKVSADFSQYGGFRRALPQLTFYWMRESAYLSDAENSYYSVVSDYIPVYSIREHARESLDYFVDLNRQINFDSDLLGFDEMATVLFDSACETDEDCGTLSTGLHATLLEYVSMSKELWEDNKVHSQVLNELELLVDDLTSGFIRLVDLYEAVEDQQIVSTHKMALFLMSAFIGVLLIFYVTTVDWEPAEFQRKILGRLRLIRLINRHTP